MEKMIKKYANRKLYDPSIHSYIGLEDIRTYIQDGHTVKVVNMVNGEDITNDILINTLTATSKGLNDSSTVELIYAILKGGKNE